MQNEWTRAEREQHKCYTRATRVNTSANSATQVRHDCYTNDTSATRMENFDFDNDTSKNIFSRPYIYYKVIKWLQRGEQFHSKNYLLEMPRFHAEIRLKSARQKLNFLMTKAISKNCILDYSCKCRYTSPHSYTK